jgi:hypothetical protein
LSLANVPISTEIEPVVISKTANLQDLLRSLCFVPPAVPESKVPAQRYLSQDELRALKDLPALFGQVAPTSRRDLIDSEWTLLFQERELISLLAGVFKDRQDDIRTIALNAMDAQLERSQSIDGISQDADGHYLISRQNAVPGSSKAFSAETAESAPTLSLDGLQALENDGLISHEDFLSMTRPVRVVDESAVLAKIKERPSLLSILSRVILPGKTRIALYVRKKA